MSERAVLKSFASVDTAEDPEYFLRYLEEISSHPLFRARTLARIDQAEIAPGQSVLDLGCGVGTDAMLIAARVGPSGRVHALDLSAAMVARARAAEAGLAIDFSVADATATGLPDASVDVVWCNRVLLFVEDTSAALAEMRRVLRPGGRIVLYELDGTSLSIGDPDQDLVNLLRDLLAATFRHPRMGVLLPALARTAGFHDVQVSPEANLLREFDYAVRAFTIHPKLEALRADGRISQARADAMLDRLARNASDGAMVVAFVGYATIWRA